MLMLAHAIMLCKQTSRAQADAGPELLKEVRELQRIRAENYLEVEPS